MVKIHTLFTQIAKSSLTASEKVSLYNTIREILIIRKVLGFQNDISEMFKRHTDIFDHFVENYAPNIGKIHTENLDTLFDMYYGLDGQDNAYESESEVISEEIDTSDSDEEEIDECSSDLSDSVTLDSEDEAVSDAASEAPANVKIVLDIETRSNNKTIEAIHTALSKQHVKSRWLVGANLVVTLGNLALTALSILVVKKAL